MEWLSLPLTIISLAFIIHGFPNIHIGIKKYYSKKDENEK